MHLSKAENLLVLTPNDNWEHNRRDRKSRQALFHTFLKEAMEASGAGRCLHLGADIPGVGCFVFVPHIPMPADRQKKLLEDVLKNHEITENRYDFKSDSFRDFTIPLRKYVAIGQSSGWGHLTRRLRALSHDIPGIAFPLSKEDIAADGPRTPRSLSGKFFRLAHRKPEEYEYFCFQRAPRSSLLGLAFPPFGDDYAPRGGALQLKNQLFKDFGYSARGFALENTPEKEPVLKPQRFSRVFIIT